MISIIVKKNLITNILLTILYGVITLIMVFHHEIWADEAQVWLIVKNLSIIDLFKHLVNEGHPSFFYLIVMPFAKLFQSPGSIIFMQIICWLSMTISVFLLLEFSPFNKLTKFAIVSSAGFLYFFPVIARSYSILPLLIFLAAILQKRSKEHPVFYAVVLALIANTHVIMFAFVFLLGLYFVYEYFLVNKTFLKKYISSALIIFGGLLAVVVQLFHTEASNGAIEFTFSELPRSLTRVFVQFFANSIDYFSSLQLSHMIMPEHVVLYFVFSIFLFAVFAVLMILPFFSNKKIFSLCILSIGFQFGIYIFAYSAIIYPTRAFTAFLIIIFCYWVMFEKDFVNKKTANLLLSVLFLLTVFNGVHFGIKDLKYNYSSAKITANFINKKIEKNAVIFPTIDAFPLAVYLFAPEKHFHSIYTHREIKYMIWYDSDIYSNKNFDKIFTVLLDKEIENMHFQDKKIYVTASDFLNNNRFEKSFPDRYKLIYSASQSLALGESFKVYEYQYKGKNKNGNF